MINCVLINRLAHFVRFGFRTGRAVGEAGRLVHPTRVTARCHFRAARMLARARPTPTPAWPRLPPANEETSASGWSRRTPRCCIPLVWCSQISPAAERQCELAHTRKKIFGLAGDAESVVRRRLALTLSALAMGGGVGVIGIRVPRHLQVRFFEGSRLDLQPGSGELSQLPGKVDPETAWD